MSLISGSQPLIPAALTDEMSEVVALVKDSGAALDNQVAATDAFDCSLDWAVRFRQFPDVVLFTLRAMVDFPVDAKQSAGTVQFQIAVTCPANWPVLLFDRV